MIKQIKLQKNIDSIKNRYQNNLELMKDSEFIFDYVHLLDYKCHKINLNRDGSYIDSPDQIKNKKGNNKSYQQKKIINVV